MDKLNAHINITDNQSYMGIQNGGLIWLLIPVHIRRYKYAPAKNGIRIF